MHSDLLELPSQDSRSSDRSLVIRLPLCRSKVRLGRCPRPAARFRLVHASPQARQVNVSVRKADCRYPLIQGRLPTGISSAPSATPTWPHTSSGICFGSGTEEKNCWFSNAPYPPARPKINLTDGAGRVPTTVRENPIFPRTECPTHAGVASLKSSGARRYKSPRHAPQPADAQALCRRPLDPASEDGTFRPRPPRAVAGLSLPHH
jgi:hypothetical protein